MIVDLPDTTTADVSRALVDLRNEGGAVALGRVLTLVISTTSESAEAAIAAANDASREHPMRVITVIRNNPGGAAQLNAQVRVGGDAGASEVVVLRASGSAGSDEEGLITGLLLPDAPVVAWWPGNDRPTTPAESALGSIAQLRLTDAGATRDRENALQRLLEGYRDGDSDFAWTRLTGWRELLAAVVDQRPADAIEEIQVSGAEDSVSTELLAGWLNQALRVPVSLERFDPYDQDVGVRGVLLRGRSGTTSLTRTSPDVVRLTAPGRPIHEVSLRRRTQRDCLSEELRRVSGDSVLTAVLGQGISAFEDRRAP